MWSKENILSCLSNRNKGREWSVAVFQCLAFGHICWRTTVIHHWQVCDTNSVWFCVWKSPIIEMYGNQA